ncbi:MAG: hypothetical protein M1396_06095 [Chloroflexi bacterium]|nr:hypothetical protein [Chloroflexota bacterium]
MIFCWASVYLNGEKASFEADSDEVLGEDVAAELAGLGGEYEREHAAYSLPHYCPHPADDPVRVWIGVVCLVRMVQ